MIWALLVLYQLKHWICDYPLQTPYMLGKFKSGSGWVLPLLAHSAVHGLGTFLIALFARPNEFGGAALLALFDMVTHFTVDRIKANPALGGRFQPLTKNEYAYQTKQHAMALRVIAEGEHDHESINYVEGHVIRKACERNFRGNKLFWWLLGLDQMAHHLTHYVIIWQLVR